MKGFPRLKFDEYALARTERKVAPGHAGFSVVAGPDVTLEEDLSRRDLTINALARGGGGALIDPFGGRRDLEARVLLHVGEAFAEDPLRVFRVAHFAAQMPNFTVHPATREFMAGMSGALAELPADRVWREFHKALAAPAPQRFIDELEAVCCLSPWLGELEGVQVDADLPGAELRYGGIGWSVGARGARALSLRIKAPAPFARMAKDLAHMGRRLRDWRRIDAEDLLNALIGCNAVRDGQRRRAVLSAVGRIAGVNMDPLDAAVGRMEEGLAAERGAWPDMEGAEIGKRLRVARVEALARAQGRRHGARPPAP